MPADALEQTVDHDAAADRIAEAMRSCQWLDRLQGAARPRSLADAYEIQERLTRQLGAELAGWKLGCTSEATQTLLGCSEPIVGRIFSRSVMQSPATAMALREDMLFLEAEFSFRLSADLPPRATVYSRREVEGAIGWVMPSIEIIQSRFVDWRKASLPEIVADLAGHGRMILGEELPHLPERDLRDTAVKISANDEQVANGHGGNVLGDPVEAVHWLANFNSGRGIGLHAGDLIAAGTCTGLSVIPVGACVIAEFAGLGTAEVRL